MKMNFVGVIVLNAMMEITMLQCPNASKKLMVGEQLDLEWRFDVKNIQSKNWSASLFIYNFTSNSKDKLVRRTQKGDIFRSPKIHPVVFRRLIYNLSVEGFVSIHLPTTNFDDTAGYGIALETTDGDSITEKLTEVSIVDMLLNEKESSGVSKAWIGQPVQLVCSVHLTSTAENPSFKWTNKVKNVTITKGIEISRTKSILTLIPMEKDDFGEFVCRARTVNTKVKYNITLIQIGYPGNPSELKVSHSKKLLSWKAPKYSQNGSPATFHVQILKDETTCTWIDVNTTSELWVSTNSLIAVLTGNFPERCTFRVCAVYADGSQNNSCSELTSIETKKSPAPTVFFAKDSNNKVKLSWQRKKDDSIPHEGYIIQIIKKSRYWNNEVIKSIYVDGKQNKADFFFQKADLIKNPLVRVCIRNSLCVYEESCSDKIAYPVYPSEPRSVRLFTNKESCDVKITWKAPKVIGQGSTNYIIEVQRNGSAQWNAVTYTQNLLACIKLLQHGDRVRVCSENNIGRKTPACSIAVEFFFTGGKEITMVKNEKDNDENHDQTVVDVKQAKEDKKKGIRNSSERLRSNLNFELAMITALYYSLRALFPPM